MLLTPTELERLTLYTAAELSRKRRNKGLRLNFPEASALIADEILEGAREGRSVAELIGFGSTILNTDDVMPGSPSCCRCCRSRARFRTAPNWSPCINRSGRADCRWRSCPHRGDSFT